MNVTIANTSNTIGNDELEAAVAAIGQQITQHFQPEWGIGATLRTTRLSLGTGEAPIDTPSEAVIYLGDRARDPDAGAASLFGYHDRNYNHISYGFVYLDVCEQYNESWSSTISHEVLELLADPTLKIKVVGPPPPGVEAANGTVDYFQEVCDPCQSDSYPINGIMVSNFVTRRYFGLIGPSLSTNHLNLALPPLGVRPKGYVQFENGGIIRQYDGSGVDAARLGARAILGDYRRNARRAAFASAPLSQQSPGRISPISRRKTR